MSISISEIPLEENGIDGNFKSDLTSESLSCRTNFIADDPTTEDEFGPHMRIAQTISAVINEKNSTGLSIGLEGSWGAGKSTVIKILRNLLAPNKEVTFIIYDAWAHEGDPLRRTFLVNVIKRLQELEWINESRWKEEIEKISGRLDINYTREEPVISSWGILFIIALFVAPIGGSFIQAALREEIIISPGAPLAVKFWGWLIVGIALYATPFIVFFFTKKRDADVSGVLLNKGATAKRTQTIKNIEPTSIEFEEKFNELMKEALVENDPKENKKIVLVLDNLDRIDTAEAISLWSTLQTFLQHRFIGNEAWAKRLWVVVLYDQKALKLLWDKSDNGANRAISTGFIDKNFQIRFEVPVPVLSNWRDFLMKQLNLAFPDHQDDDFHAVARVLAIRRMKEKLPPTIREIKLYVNQIGVLHRQWTQTGGNKDVFPLGHLAYYVVLKREDCDIIEHVLNSQSIEAEYLSLLGEEVRSSLVALHYNVNPRTARQILFKQDIINALESSSGKELDKIAESSPQGFWENLEQIIASEWDSRPQTSIACAAFALQSAQIWNNQILDQPIVKHIKRVICQIAEGVNEWNDYDEQKSAGLKIILGWMEQSVKKLNDFDEYVKKICTAITAGLRSIIPENPEKSIATNWLNNFYHAIKDLRNDHKQISYQAITKTVENEIQRGKPLSSAEFEHFLEILAILHHEYMDARYIAENTLKRLAEDEYVEQRFQGIRKTASAQGYAWFAYLKLRYAPDKGISSVFRAVANDSENKFGEWFVTEENPLITTFVNILTRFKELNLLFKFAAVDETAEKITKQSLKKLLRDPINYQLILGGDSVAKLEFIYSIIDSADDHEVFKLLTKHLVAGEQLVGEVISFGFKAGAANLYCDVLEAAPDDSARDFIIWCEKGLREIPAEQWQLHLAENGRLLELAFKINEFDYEINLKDNFLRGIIDWTKTLIDESTALENNPILKGEESNKKISFKSNIAELLGGVSERWRVQMRSEIVSLFQKAPGILPEFFLPVFEDELKNCITLLEKEDTQSNVLKLFFEKGGETGVGWIYQTLSQLNEKQLKKLNKTRPFKSFRYLIQRELSFRKPDEFFPLYSATISQIAELLNIKPIANGLIVCAREVIESWEIWTLGVDGGNSTRLTFDAEGINDLNSKKTLNIQPAWSPDGKKIAFTSNINGHFEIHIINADGRNREPITRDIAGSSEPSWSPDGRKIAFTRGEGLAAEIYILDLLTGNEKQLTNSDDAGNSSASWSPDGKTIIYQKTFKNDYSNIYELNIEKEKDNRIDKEQVSVKKPQWSPDSEKILYLRSEDGKDLVCLAGARSNAESLIPFDKAVQDARWSPDGKFLIVGTAVPEYELLIIENNGNKIANKILISDNGHYITPDWQPLTTESFD